MIVGVRLMQNKRADDVDDEPQDGDRQGFAVMHRNRRQQALHGFERNAERDQTENHALVNAARSPNLPEPKVKRVFCAWRRASQ